MTLHSFFSSAVESWAGYYGDHRMVSVTVRFLHLGALLLGGGTALAADRQVLTTPRAARGASLRALDASHRIVVPSLALVVITGLLMTASDVSTFVNSRLYWTKMGLVTLLLLNGTALLAFERRAKLGRDAGFTGLAVVSILSLLLWLVILFFGVWLTAAA
jgi:uncharacterized membrane-anchored protein